MVQHCAEVGLASLTLVFARSIAGYTAAGNVRAAVMVFQHQADLLQVAYFS